MSAEHLRAVEGITSPGWTMGHKVVDAVPDQKSDPEPKKRRFQPNWREILSNLAEVGGITAISGGLGWYSPGLGLISAGIGLVALGVASGATGPVFREKQPKVVNNLGKPDRR